MRYLSIFFISLFVLSFCYSAECTDVQSINNIPCEVKTLALNCSTDATITSNAGTYNMAITLLNPVCTNDCIYNFTWLNTTLDSYKIETCNNKYAILSVIRTVQPQDCPAGSYVYSIDNNGTIRCANETDPLWSSNLTAFNLCPANYFAIGIYGNGSMNCAFSNSSSYGYNMSSPFYDWLNRDLTSPVMNIIQPKNLETMSFEGYISFTLSTNITDANNISSMWYVFKGINTTFYNNTATIHVEQADGTTQEYTMVIYANDSSNNIGSSSIKFTITQTARPVGTIGTPIIEEPEIEENETEIAIPAPIEICSLSSMRNINNCFNQFADKLSKSVGVKIMPSNPKIGVFVFLLLLLILIAILSVRLRRSWLSRKHEEIT